MIIGRCAAVGDERAITIDRIIVDQIRARIDQTLPIVPSGRNIGPRVARKGVGGMRAVAVKILADEARVITSAL